MEVYSCEMKKTIGERKESFVKFSIWSLKEQTKVERNEKEVKTLGGPAVSVYRCSRSLIGGVLRKGTIMIDGFGGP